MDLSITQTTEEEASNNPRTPYLGWDSLSQDDLSMYKGLTEKNLSKVKLNHDLMMCDDCNCRETKHITAIDTMYESITTALKQSSEAFVQYAAENSQRRQHSGIPGWSEYCSEVHANARDAFLEWVSSGRPRYGYLLQHMQRTRAAFKQALRRCKADESRASADRVARQFLTKDSKKFWAEIKKINGKTSAPVASTIGAATGHKNIAELWRTHYNGLLNSTPPYALSLIHI